MTLNLDILENIEGENNNIIFYTTENDIENLTENEFELLDNFDLHINGSNNTIKIKMKERKDIDKFLRREGLYINITGNNNIIDLGLINYCINPLMNMTGLQLFIGGKADIFIAPDKPRYANNCTLKIDDGTAFCGTMIYLQDDNSEVTIGKDCAFSWGIDVWCTDAHTILDKDNKPTNFGKSIEIGDHVWVGKDVKINKNTKVSNNSIIGWGSIVTKKFTEENVIITGNPAAIVKTDINWDVRDLQNYQL